MDRGGQLLAMVTGVALAVVSGAAHAPPKPKLAPIVVSELQPLRFGNAVAGVAQTVVIPPDGAGAAVFSATGEPNQPVVATVVDNNAWMELQGQQGGGQNQRVEVDTWQYGGSLAADGTAVFDSLGELTNLRIGATAHVGADDLGGAYGVSLTLRLDYQ